MLSLDQSIRHDSSQSPQQSRVWVAYAAKDQQYNIALDFFEGMTVEDAIVQSQIRQLANLPELLECGIFGEKISSLNHVLEVGDRVEIYRPLTINPKDKRRKRAAENPVGLYCRGNRFKLSK